MCLGHVLLWDGCRVWEIMPPLPGERVGVREESLAANYVGAVDDLFCVITCPTCTLLPQANLLPLGEETGS
jgi:hypothetical protein